ncbi:MAG: AAA family ATPase, partial [Cetobacterium sp.]
MKKGKSDDRVSFLNKYGLGGYKITINKWVDYCKKEGLDWKNELLTNPYKIMKLKRSGFRYADAVAMKIGFDKKNPIRIKAFITNALEDISQGSTILDIAVVLKHIDEKLKINDYNLVINTVINNPEKEGYTLLNSAYKRTDELIESKWITKNEWYGVEKQIFELCVKANKIESLTVDKSIVERVKESLPFKLNEMQNYAVDNILIGGVNILTGVAGGGKTFTTKAILQVLKKHKQTFTCLAPTGIASKVFMESTGFECSTIHRAFYEGKVIDTDWLILEESSMLSCDHFALLLSMLPKTPKMLFIGDISQLQPISAGSVMRDMLRLIEQKRVKGNVIRLSEIMRASDQTFIPHLCKKFTRLDNYSNTLEEKVHQSVSFERLGGDFIKQVVGVINRYKFSFLDTYILIPQNVGAFGTGVINKYIDEKIIGGEIVHSFFDKQWRIGSVLMHIKNNSERDIYNGERLILKRKEKRGEEELFYAEKISDGTIVVYDKKTLEEQTMLSYSVSVHKTQGITAKNVVFIASKSHSFMLTRELVYTGLSRASENLVILHDESVLARASK